MAGIVFSNPFRKSFLVRGLLIDLRGHSSFEFREEKRVLPVPKARLVEIQVDACFSLNPLNEY